MATYNVCTIRPKGFLHSSAFAEIKDSLVWSLTALGDQVTEAENIFAPPPTVNIVFGAGLLAPNSRLQPDTICYNLDGFAYPATENLLTLVKASPGVKVWDHSLQSVEEWRQRGIEVRHVPVGFTPNLVRIPQGEIQDIDCAFLGWLTPRRRKLADNLIAAGLKVYFSDCCYGAARDNIYSRSKVVLNVHHDGRNRFEIARVSYLLANSKCVVSEISSDDREYEWLDVLRCSPEDVVSECRELVFNDARRLDHEQVGFNSIRHQDFGRTIWAALNEKRPNLAAPHRAPIADRYERSCREGDMKDFAPLLRSVVKGKVLEIGVRDGASTSALLMGLEERGGELTSVDIADCKLWEHPQWHFLRVSSRDLDILPQSLDMAFIDGDHSPEGFRIDLENCLRWVKPGGIILCHDISPLPNYTAEARGGDWPSQYVGDIFFKVCGERKLRHFVYPGAWGMGCILLDPVIPITDDRHNKDRELATVELR